MLGIVLIVILVIAILAFCRYVNHPPNTHALRNLEGPPPYFFVGHVPYFPRDFCEMTKMALRWWRKYKSPIAIKMLHRNFSVVFDANQIEKIMKDPNNITKSSDYRLIEPWLGQGLLISSGDKWYHRRKLLTPAFHYQILKEFMPIFNDQATTLTKLIADEAAQSKGNAINVSPFLTKCTLDIICETAMGKRLNAQNDADCKYAKDIVEFTDLVVYRIMNPWFRFNWIWKMTWKGWKWRQLIARMHAFTIQIINEREHEMRVTSASNGSSIDAKIGRHGRKAFLDLLLEMKADGKLSDANVREEVDTFMFEGHDTTATGLMWAMYCIGLHKEIQKQLHEEILTVCGADEPVTTEHLPELQLLDRVLKESQRMYPSVPIIGRTITHPIEIVDGTTLPKGIQTDIAVLGLHRNPEWFPDPEKFDPDRFLPDNVEKRHPFAFMPFAAGQRNCIGQKFAFMEEKVILVHLMRNFEFVAVQNPKTIRMIMALVLRPFDGIWLKLKQRR